MELSVRYRILTNKCVFAQKSILRHNRVGLNPYDMSHATCEGGLENTLCYPATK